MSVHSISPLDGRYERVTRNLVTICSDYGYISYCLIVECAYFLSLSRVSEIGMRALSVQEIHLLEQLPYISADDAKKIQMIEYYGIDEIKKTNHDLKAIEYFLKDILSKSSMSDLVEWVHFGLTSDDVKNIAYAMMLRDASALVINELDKLLVFLKALSSAYANVPMLARTHGQPSSPTTVGKEFNVFRTRLMAQMMALRSIKISAKLNGASGNYNAQHLAYPQVDWIQFSKNFINSFVGIVPDLVTTQINSHDSYAEIFDALKRINTIIIGLDQDMWRYLSDGWFVQRVEEGEVGSSTMPHKVNPQDFETSEGNLGVANALFEFFSKKLPISRLQRDSSDYSVKRNFGVAFGHSLVGYEYASRGLKKLILNEEQVRKDLEAHPEVLTEAIQTLFRKEGILGGYEKLRDMARGKKLELEDVRAFVRDSNLSQESRDILLALTPSLYTGIANQLAKLDPYEE